ncbi:MAG: serine hydrolase domain-containing protein [Geminicoccaceae bacterium]
MSVSKLQEVVSGRGTIGHASRLPWAAIAGVARYGLQGASRSAACALIGLALVGHPAMLRAAEPPASVLTVQQSVPPFATQLKPLLMRDLRATKTPGALVYIDDPKLGQWAAALGSSNLAGAPLDIRSHMRIGSVTKTLTATAVLRLADRGLIHLDRPIAAYLPGLVPNGKAITVRQLLNMTSGLFNTTEDCSLNQLLDRDPYHSFTVREALSYAFRHPPYFPPGKGWHYANTNYDVLGLLLEKVTGQSAPVVLRHQIFEPLQLTGTALPGEGFAGLPRPHPRGYQFGTNVQGLNAYLALLRGDIDDARIDVPRGTPPTDATFWNLSYSWTSGSVTSTLADMAVWAKALATGRLLSPKLHRQQLRPAPGTTYGLGITEVLPGFLGHSGAVNGFQSVIGYSPKRGATIVVLVNNQLAPNTPFPQAVPADRLAGLIYRTLFADKDEPAATTASGPVRSGPVTVKTCR